MSGCLCCFAKNGGLLVYYRTFGDFGPLPLPVLASLNGAHDYLLDFKTEILSFSSGEERYIWREHHDCLKFVLILRTPSPVPEDRHVFKLLDFLWMVLVSTVGEKVLLEKKDDDLLKRYLAQSAGVIDAVVAGFLGHSELVLGISLGATLFAYASNATTLRHLMENFCSEFSITHCAILSKDRFVALSSALSSFEPDDLLLLDFTAITNPSPDVISEKIVFLPHFSPNLAYRLVTVKLASTVFFIFLAGADFLLDNVVQTRIDTFWKNELDAVKKVMDLPPKWLPSAVEQQLPQSLQGMLLWNTENKRYLMSPVWPAVTEERAVERLRLLIRFYRVVSFLLEKGVERKGPPLRDLYQSMEERKFYFIQRQKYQMYAMFDLGEPQHSLKHVCEIMLALCTKRQAAQPL